MCGIFSILAVLHPPKDNPDRLSVHTKHLRKIKTDGIVFFGGLNIYDMENLEELNNLNINVFELNEEKTLTQLFVSTNMNGNEHDKVDIHEDSYEENYKDIFDEGFQIYVQGRRKKNDLGLYQNDSFLIKKLHLYF